MCYFDITNMYTNIPTNQMTAILRITLNNQNTQHNMTAEIMNMATITKLLPIQ